MSSLAYTFVILFQAISSPSMALFFKLQVFVDTVVDTSLDFVDCFSIV